MIKVQCPYCEDGYGLLRESIDKSIVINGEGVPSKCKKCKEGFMVFLSMAPDPNKEKEETALAEGHHFLK